MISVFNKKVMEAASLIPRGRVATYRSLAEAVGKPRAMRAVANTLAGNHLKDVPCHRVVRADGAIGGYNGLRGDKTLLLKKEGVAIISGRIDLNKYLYRFTT